MDTTTRLTREELYDLIWTRPISKLATEFGISDVGLAKICRRLDIPRPGRGHWGKLAAGKTPRRAPLPPTKADNPQSIELVLRPVEVQEKTKLDVPTVVVPADLRGAHEATRRLNKLLDAKPFGDPPMHVLRGRERTVLRVGPQSKRRALLALDALFKALETRGHRVHLEETERSYRGHQIGLSAVVSEEVVELALIERSGQKPHVLTHEETERERRFGSGWV